MVCGSGSFVERRVCVAIAPNLWPRVPNVGRINPGLPTGGPRFTVTHISVSGADHTGFAHPWPRPLCRVKVDGRGHASLRPNKPSPRNARKPTPTPRCGRLPPLAEPRREGRCQHPQPRADTRLWGTDALDRLFSGAVGGLASDAGRRWPCRSGSRLRLRCGACARSQEQPDPFRATQASRVPERALP